MSDQSKQDRPTSTSRQRKCGCDYEILREVFNLYDTDGNGAIETKELVRLMRSAGQCLTRSEADKLISDFDKNANGRLEFAEFVDMMSAFAEKSNVGSASTPDGVGDADVEEKRRIFELLDRNRDGFISRAELNHVMNDLLREGLTETELDQMMATADTDGDGQISFEEFSQLATSMRIFR